MNTELQKLFEKYSISLKDRHEFSQLFMFLPEYKKIYILDHFTEIVENLFELRKELATQQGILLGEALGNIEEKVFLMQKQKLQKETRQEIGLLRYVL